MIAAASALIALSCPNTIVFKSRLSVFKILRSSLETLRDGIRAAFAITFSISCLLIILRCFDLGKIFCAAPASSIISIALSGKFLSLMKRADNSAAEVRATTVYLTP